jgi:hypothetical protein
MSKNNVINVELYDLPITNRTDDRCGKVVNAGSMTEEDLIQFAVSRRTDLNAATLRASLEILKDAAVENIINGNTVHFGLAYFLLDVKGVFVGDHAGWDSKKHSLTVHATPATRLRNAVKEASVNVLGMASTGVVINSVTDVFTGEVNQRLTPGGGVNLAGSKIKIAGEDSSVGLFLILQETQDVISISMGSILINEPSKISFILPNDLPVGDYKLMITTQFTAGTVLLKEPRSYLFDYVLNYG